MFCDTETERKYLQHIYYFFVNTFVEIKKNH